MSSANRILILIVTLYWPATGTHTKANKELIHYVKNRYERTLFGIEHLFYPPQQRSQDAVCLYIIFMGQAKNKYSMWSWFWNDQEVWDRTAFLFLKDDTFSWYVGKEERTLIPAYSSLIKHYLDQYHIHPDQLFMIGSSMGGYAALLYGILFACKAVFAFRPQIDYESASLYFNTHSMRSSWIDLNELITEYSYIPKIYLNYGSFEPDKCAAEKFICSVQKRDNAILLVHKTDNLVHMGFEPTKDFILNTLSYLNKITLNGK